MNPRTFTGKQCNQKARNVFGTTMEKIQEELDKPEGQRSTDRLTAYARVADSCGNDMIGDDEERIDE